MTGKIVAQVKYTRTKKTGEGTPATAVGKLEKKKQVELTQQTQES